MESPLVLSSICQICHVPISPKRELPSGRSYLIKPRVSLICSFKLVISSTIYQLQRISISTQITEHILTYQKQSCAYDDAFTEHLVRFLKINKIHVSCVRSKNKLMVLR